MQNNKKIFSVICWGGTVVKSDSIPGWLSPWQEWVDLVESLAAAAAAVLGMLCSQLTRGASAACGTHGSVTLPAQNNYEEQHVQRFQLSYLKCTVALFFFNFWFSFWFTDLWMWIWAGQKLCSQCLGLALHRSLFYFKKHLKVLTVKFHISWSQEQLPPASVGISACIARGSTIPKLLLSEF